MSAPIQASASVHVVPASNCVRSSTRIPERKPGDTGVTSIAESSSGKKLKAPPKGGPGEAAVWSPWIPTFADDRIYLIRPLPRPLRRRDRLRGERLEPPALLSWRSRSSPQEG